MSIHISQDFNYTISHSQDANGQNILSKRDSAETANMFTQCSILIDAFNQGF